ncbi:glycosyltransferase family 4 protein [Caldibacillus thermoamylovorans]|uniref:glycosyltransferase family 4 protein n=1 Tax=Caldibacillus thermoamylovorans TaxID=35841 RepID=UPI0022E95B89|nr:glycosyltransferase family 4 protein [Caldibacillus thermoamylovorans]
MSLNVMTVNKFYYIKGGSETYLFALENELRKRSISVFPFSMKDEKNKETITSEFFVDNIDYNNASFIKKIVLSSKIIYSIEAKKKINNLLDNYKIDIAHLHLFQHQLSPSILAPIKKRGIPVVYTVHDLKVMCPNYKMMTHGSICEQCKGGKFYNVVLNKCTKDSYLGSLVNMTEAYVHSFLKTYSNSIDFFITPSYFYKEKMIEWGFPEEKIEHIPNFVNPNDFTPCYDFDNYFLYFGRLSEEKGLFTLLRAVNITNSNIKVKIVGTGPLKEEIHNFINENRLNSKVEVLGFKSGSELVSLIKGAKAVLMPSEWYENGPLALIESFALGKIVIGSNIGGIPEHIDEGKNGFLFEPKNEFQFANILDIVNSMNKKELVNMGKNARRKVERIYNNDYHVEKILNVYNSLIAQKVVENND